MNAILRRLAGEDHGQDLIEYALLAAFIALAVTAALVALGSSISGLFSTVSGKLDASAPSGGGGGP